jgi:hypothetical protein
MRRLLTLILVAGTLGSAGCARERATLEQCQEILDRIVDLELRERGFRDPALERRKREEMRTLLAHELRRCQGRPLRESALTCVRRAKSNEELSHTCLR